MIPARQLALVPGCAGGRAPLAVLPLPGGLGRNEVLRIDTPEGRFVWRARLAPVDRPGAAALTELRAHRLAAAAGLAPALLDAAADGSWMLMEYVEAPPWTAQDLCSAQGAMSLGERLAALHAVAVPPELPTADAPAMAEGYLAGVRARDPLAARSLAPLRARVVQLTAELAGSGLRRTLAHGDLAASNMLGPLPMLVDWEYAQAADPGWDCACLLSYYPALQTWLSHLLGSAGVDGGQDRARFGLQRERFALLNRLWEQAYPSNA